ncbi:sugar phosphate nucleotidyltransferase, partial [Candidatus Marinimicrobia bacterium]|nr:sugar phosphate nucleotidyltransferase [Candidatus Neomarinimicrobiota bacterium]
MNIIIPLGGIGSRFSDNKYTKPKPLIKVLGKEIIFWLLDSLKVSQDDKLFIPYNQFLDAYDFEEIVLSKYPNINLIALPPTNGPVETLKLCLEHFQISDKIVLLDGDTWYNEDILKKVRNIDKNLTTYFISKSNDPLFSYIEVEEKQIINVKEKIKISDFANSGCYVFENALQVLKYIHKIEKSGERFVSDIISKMISDGIYFSSIEVKDFHVLGTPQQIIEFSQLYSIECKRFVFDLDNTLVTFPQTSGDYSTVLPIQKTINYLKRLKAKGHYIIIYTARRMRTHNGDINKVIDDIKDITIEKLKEFDIPYDEIIFGKPYAHFYIDDLMISPKTDLNKELGFYMEDVSPRHFNKLIFDDDTVTKTSKNLKLNGESYYYNEMKKYHLDHLFPKILHSENGKIVMEKIKGINFSTLFVNEVLTTKHIDRLFKTIDEIHSTHEDSSFEKYYDYSEKLKERFKSFDYDNYGFLEEDRSKLLNSLKNISGDLCIIHGDLVFSNIILTKN